MSIFIHMTAYRGFDVVPTVLDCLDKAKHRDDVHFGICLQQDEEVPSELVRDRIVVDRIPIRDSLGHGWARSRAQSIYNGQDFSLQIDSGCRFIPNWDEQMIQALLVTGSGKAIITNPANNFNFTSGELEHKEVSYKLQPFQFVENTPSVWPSPLKGAVALQRASIASDHFMFAHGTHCRECPHDPELYYTELECAVTLRSFTLGYDIFNHFKPTVFRNYGPRLMHWNDDADWWQKDWSSKARFSKLINGELTQFGLGGVRSARDFELYSGIDLKGRRIQRDVLSSSVPPIKFEDEAKWESNYMKDYAITVTWDPSKIEHCDDYDYWLFDVEDASGNPFNRQDLRWERDKDALEKRTSSKKIFFKAMSSIKPAKIGIQPYSKSRGALTKVTFDI